ncbi:MAG: class I SAM-dependent methyltransferase [Hyphomicrobium sp.]
MLPAIESARPDAIFKDPLAERLAGKKGKAIAARAAKNMHNGWPVIARTKVIDDLILASVAVGCDCVVNLAAGLDTRPYRLDLPATLHWIEADLPGIIDEKTAQLASETPRCVLERVKVDLADAAARDGFLDQMVRNHKRALVLSEGLIMYLEEDTVRGLSHSLDRPGIAWWLLDTISPAILAALMKRMAVDLRQAPMHFAPESGIAFFEDLGWRARRAVARRRSKAPAPPSLATQSSDGAAFAAARPAAFGKCPLVRRHPPRAAIARRRLTPHHQRLRIGNVKTARAFGNARNGNREDTCARQIGAPRVENMNQP